MIASRTRRAAAPCLLGLLVFLVHCRGNMGCADSMWSVPTAVSLVDHGDADLDEYLPVVRARLNLFTEWHRGHVYTMFPIGTSLLVAPAIPILRGVAAIAIHGDPERFRALERWQMATGCPTVAGEPIVSLSSISELILASAIVALTTMVMFAVGRAEGLSTVGSVVLAAVFAFGTSAWSTASRSLWQHGPSMLLLSLALWLQIRARLAPAVGALLAFAYVVRPTNAIALAMGGLWTLLARRRQAIGFALGAAAVLVLFVIANERMFAMLLPPYFRPQRLGASGTFWEALAADLISPGRGLLIFSPVLAFSVAGVALKIRDGRFSLLDGSLAACILLHGVAIASFPHWWGGHSYGPRFFSDMLPYLVYFLIPVIAWIGAASGVRRLAVASAFAAAAGFSVFVHAEGALVHDAMMWNTQPVPIDAHPERVWDWRDPQVLAGIRPRP